MVFAGRFPAASGATPRLFSYAAPLLALALFATKPTDAHAIIQGSASSLGGHTVQIVDRAGRLQCSGVAIDRAIVITAGHCARRGMVVAGGQVVAVARVSRGSIVTESGIRVRIGGDAAFLRLREPLPSSVAPISVGSDGGAQLTVAGYGATDEAHPVGGALNEATLVRAGRGLLVDPHRQGQIGASACFGDSGGPVVSGNQLVGVITRASYPRARIACGYYTHYAPVVATGQVAVDSNRRAGVATASHPRRGKKRRRR